jgi:hypothetical protein
MIKQGTGNLLEKREGYLGRRRKEDPPVQGS